MFTLPTPLGRSVSASVGPVAGSGNGLVYVGGKTASTVGVTTTWSTSLTDLTGGIASAPVAGDVVIVGYCVGGIADLTIGVNTSGYTEEIELYADGSNDTNLSVSWKIMGGSPDTSVELSSTTSTLYAGSVVIHVWRGANQSTPMDVAVQSATGAGNGKPNPPAITPVTDGAVIIAIGGSVSSGTLLSGTELSNALEIFQSDTSGANIGIGSYEWVSGEFDPALWGGSASSASSWAAATLALRPA